MPMSPQQGLPVTQVGSDGVVIDTTLPQEIVGNVVADGVDTGKPVKIGSKVATATTGHATVAVGDRQDLLMNPNGAIAVGAFDYGGNAGNDDQNHLIGFSTRDAVGATPKPVAIGNHVLNGNGRWDRLSKPSATSRIASAAASVNATLAKATPGNLFKVFGNNVKASVVYLKIYNKATAPTVGTDAPVLTIPLAASSRFDIDIGSANGFHFTTGIAYGFTTDAADVGTTALSAGDILGFTLTYS